MHYKTIAEVVEDLESNPIEKGGNIYHPIPFQEFTHLKTSSNSNEVYKKWELIKQTLNLLYHNKIDNIKVLDVGANAGFYTFSLAKAGAKVTSFELHPRYKYIGEFLVKEKQFDIKWNGVKFDPTLINNQHFDVALMLSVFQWMADGGKKMEEANKCLKEVSEKSRYLFFELGFNQGKSCIKTTKHNHYAELVRLLKEKTVYNHFMLLGTTELWGSNCRYIILCSNERQFEDSFYRRLMRMVRL
ncbi:MAG: methyltransferase domain-containing protein [Candidatus Scalindua sp.]|nr:methyltransferase domain-containing protein [Candidatus Scalindua sp.]MBT6227975.1 methyltransferase domain-containing protein [Candidatus Scalindua sp.]MBT6561709.1 methyltransferase domain-containing protein [Candidatus Scalindua sp.]MBT7211111.1 methyltransferase domain-containing protein [Candidatus Scalindua sp.]